MNKTIFELSMIMFIGATVTVAGLSIPAENLLTEARSAANSISRQQLALALEFYYSDHGTYPTVEGGEELIGKLSRDGYIHGKSLRADIFQYESKEGGQDYAFVIAPQEMIR